ncbi:hypothetical protein ACQEWB_18530 [Streptomyces sp. CA-249302]|uniref:hypothetical protein n=1 Tax=Streptomyces sp. CA-249302 TaxID=3240058 RepID=UPI003D909E55
MNGNTIQYGDPVDGFVVEELAQDITDENSICICWITALHAPQHDSAAVAAR